MPCIEFWFLLHFKPYSNKIYRNCNEVIQELKQFLPDYKKTKGFLQKLNIYKALVEKGDQALAIKTAIRLCKEYQKSDNIQLPYSEIRLFLSSFRTSKPK